MAGKTSTVVATSQTNNVSKKARRHAKKAYEKAIEKAAEKNAKDKATSQREIRAEATVDLEEKRRREWVARTIAEQQAYWSLSVEQGKALNPNYVEIPHVLNDGEEIDRLLDDWSE
ncbi:Ff.00g039840.m01.CDS01 [Fusarium sp. VM40]|nr:Ff.00g039840.m01.CDS01 [Fusarium sp. VM40]